MRLPRWAAPIFPAASGRLGGSAPPAGVPTGGGTAGKSLKAGRLEVGVLPRWAAAGILAGLVLCQGRGLESQWNECAAARENLTRSGLARDAKESFWGGKVKPEEPRTQFSPDDAKITWWGEFKPFETWKRLETEVQWVDPYGRVARREKIRGGKCRLMKATLSPKDLPFRMVDGVWLVHVGCPDDPIDVKRFLVKGPMPVEGGVDFPAAPAAPSYREIVVEKRK